MIHYGDDKGRDSCVFVYNTVANHKRLRLTIANHFVVVSYIDTTVYNHCVSCATLQALEGILAVAHGYLSSSSRAMIDSCVSSCLELLLTSTTGYLHTQPAGVLLSTSAERVALLHMTKACLLTPWPDGASSTLRMDARRVATVLSSDCDSVVAREATLCVRLCDNLICSRTPPIEVVRRDGTATSGTRTGLGSPSQSHPSMDSASLLDRIRATERSVIAAEEAARQQKKADKAANKKEKKKTRADGKKDDGTDTNNDTGSKNAPSTTDSNATDKIDSVNQEEQQQPRKRHKTLQNNIHGSKEKPVTESHSSKPTEAPSGRKRSSKAQTGTSGAITHEVTTASFPSPSKAQEQTSSENRVLHELGTGNKSQSSKFGTMTTTDSRPDKSIANDDSGNDDGDENDGNDDDDDGSFEMPDIVVDDDPDEEDQ